jgi:hypothetical protein
VASLLGSLIPANSKTVRRSRQLPAIAPGIAASACWIRSYSFESSRLSEDGSDFRSFGAGLFAVSVPRLAPWAAFLRRAAAGSIVAVFCDAFSVWVVIRLLILAGLGLLQPRGRGRPRYVSLEWAAVLALASG